MQKTYEIVAMLVIVIVWLCVSSFIIAAPLYLAWTWFGLGQKFFYFLPRVWQVPDYLDFTIAIIFLVVVRNLFVSPPSITN